MHRTIVLSFAGEFPKLRIHSFILYIYPKSIKLEIIKNIIIGAGPAGLAMAGRLHHAGIDYTILEKSKKVGNAWHNHYDRLHLHTVKQWSHLPYMPFPNDFPTYVSRKQLVDYFDKYVARFNIQPIFNEEINSIKKKREHWQLNASSGKSYFAENVIIATGLNSKPNIPKWEGQEEFNGDIIHSAFYKNPKPYIGKKTLVVGFGNTGAEVALDLSEHGVETYVVARGEISLVPRDLNGRPVQVTAKQLEKLPFGFGDWLGSQIRKIYFGNVKKYGIKVAKGHPAVLLKETGKTPLIDIGTITAIKKGQIKILPDIDYFTAKGVQFKNGQHIDFDSVILATGFHAKIEKLIERGQELLDKYNCPKGAIAAGYHKGIYFVGFDNYKLGGIIGTIVDDSKTVVEVLSDEV